MGEQTMYVRIVGEPFLSRAKAYRERLAAWGDAWRPFVQERGGDGVSVRGTALSFKNGKAPEGWTRPAGNAGMSHPKKGHPDVEALARLRECAPRPDTRDVFGDEIPHNLSWEAEDGGRGSCGIGNMGLILNGPHVGWAGDIYLGWAADPQAAVAAHLAAHPDHRIVGPAADWALPKGLIRLTEAEYELIFAEHKVAEERAITAAAPILATPVAE